MSDIDVMNGAVIDRRDIRDFSAQELQDRLDEIHRGSRHEQMVRHVMYAYPALHRETVEQLTDDELHCLHEMALDKEFYKRELDIADTRKNERSEGCLGKTVALKDLQVTCLNDYVGRNGM